MLITPVLTKTTWVLKSFTLTRKLMSAQNVIRYFPSKFYGNVDLNCSEGNDQYKSKNISNESKDSYQSNLKDICKKNLQNIVI